MLESIFLGAGLAFAAAIQPGPLQAYLFSRVTAFGWRRTLPASFSPLLSDGPIAFLALFVLGRLSPTLQNAFRAAGGLLLLYLSFSTYRQWRRGGVGSPETQAKVPRTFLEAALVNLLNPNPYLGWALILGPAVLAAWREAPANGVAVVAAFYVTMIAGLAASILAFGSTRFLGPKFQRGLLLASAVILAFLGIYQLSVSLPRLAALLVSRGH